MPKRAVPRATSESCRALAAERLVLDAVRLVGVGAEAAMTIRFVIGEVAFEPLDVAIAFEREDVGRDPIEEPPIVTDHDRAARELLEAVLERAQRIDVEIVRRL